jgi:predicted outer membrane repeat protein
VTIDAQELGRVIDVGGADSPASIIGFTLTNGRATGDGQHGCGGGMFLSGSDVALRDLVLAGNRADVNGGGIYCEESSVPELTRVTFTGNSTDGQGGGLFCSKASPILEECEFAANRSLGHGGAISCCNGAAPIIARSRLAGSLAQGESNGGAIFCTDECQPEFEDCLITGNSAANGGGVYWEELSSLVMRGCTVAENSAVQGGGGLACGNSVDALVESTIIAFSAAGEAVSCGEGSVIEMSCCDLFDNAGGDWVGCIAENYGHHGNIAEDPQFCGDANPDEPYSLQETSPCAEENNPTCGRIGALAIGCEATCVEGIEDLPLLLALHPARPNPFHRATVLAYDLPATAPVTLKIYDLSGRLVRVLVDRARMPAGRHGVAWNGENAAQQTVSAGVYFCRLQTGNSSRTRCLHLLK